MDLINHNFIYENNNKLHQLMQDILFNDKNVEDDVYNVYPNILNEFDPFVSQNFFILNNAPKWLTTNNDGVIDLILKCTNVKSELGKNILKRRMTNNDEDYTNISRKTFNRYFHHKELTLLELNKVDKNRRVYKLQ